MKAFCIDRYGKNIEGRICDIPVPAFGDNDVLVQIYAAAVNPLDAKIKNGDFKRLLRYPLPLILGHDLAGTVVQVGVNVKRFKVGDEIYARPADDHIGTFAEFIAVNENDIAAKPSVLTMEEAASIPLVALTAWQVLVEKAGLRKGQKVLVHAGAGGVGIFAIQLAKHLGATVATTTSAANTELVKSLGADIVIDYQTQNFEEVLKDYDVVLNTLGADVLSKSLKVLKPGGNLLSISGPPDPGFARTAGLSWFLKIIMYLLSYRIRRKAKGYRVKYAFVFMQANGEQLQKITTLINAGILRPVIDRIFPFESIREALKYVETGRAKGKVVVKIK